MYYILEKELKNKKITRDNLSKKLGISISTLSCKLNGKNAFTYPECKKIKEVLNYPKTIDELFQTD